MTLFDRALGQRVVSARVCRSSKNAPTVFESLSVRHLALRLPRATVLRSVRLAQERTAPVAGTTQRSLGGHFWSVRKLSVHVVHVPLRLHLADCPLHH